MVHMDYGIIWANHESVNVVEGSHWSIDIQLLVYLHCITLLSKTNYLSELFCSSVLLLRVKYRLLFRFKKKRGKKHKTSRSQVKDVSPVRSSPARA